LIGERKMADITTNVQNIVDQASQVAAQVADTAQTVASDVAQTVTNAIQPVVADVKTDVQQVVADVQPVVEEVKKQGFIAKIIAKIIALFKAL
jgi:uncharacterized protein (UPF0335 family)